ncbi:hypothetical protein LINPERHAP2_LOCUS37344 [Linum perenne]
MDSDVEESLKKRQKKNPFSGDSSRRGFIQEEDTRLETTRARFTNLLKRHGELAERLSRDSDKMIFERLQKEFEAARASQTQEVYLDGEEWNDGLLATIRERVHMEAERKAMAAEPNNMPANQAEEKITYKAGNKVICCLEGARIGIQYETTFAGEPCELYHCVLESRSFLEKMTVPEHTVPFFLPIRDAENDLLSSNAMAKIYRFCWRAPAVLRGKKRAVITGSLYCVLQVRILKELYGNQIGELYHSLPYHLIEFVLDDFDCKVTVSLRYSELVAVLPSRVRVFAWPINQFKKTVAMGSHPNPTRLSYAEEAMRNMTLPEAYAEMVLNLPQALQQVVQDSSPC